MNKKKTCPIYIFHCMHDGGQIHTVLDNIMTATNIFITLDPIPETSLFIQ